MGLIRRRLDAHAHDIEVVLPVLHRLEELFRESEDLAQEERSNVDPKEPSELVGYLKLEGLLLVGSLQTRTDPPSLRHLNDWRAHARDMVRILRSTDPACMTAYAADLPRKDQRLLRSM